MLIKKVVKILKISYLILAILIFILELLPSGLGFAASSKDILINKASNILLILIILVLPGVLILSQSIRKKVPLFRKEKLLYTILGWGLLGVVGISVYFGVNSLHSTEYKVAEDKYHTELAAKKSTTTNEEDAATEADIKAKEETDAKAEEEAKIAEEKVKEEQARQAEAEKVLNTEDAFKAACVDIPWAEIVKDRTTYKGTYLKKDLMVRQIASINDETVYLCGEKKAEGVYTGGLFVVFDKRSDKSRPIELYDKIYMYGQVSGLWYTGGMNNHIEPHVDAKYIQFNGKFGS